MNKPATILQLDIFESRTKVIHFDGSDIIPEYDNVRLTGQLQKIFDLMKDGKYRTLSEIENITGYPGASISAQLRNLRKIRFGGHTVNRRARGERVNGLFEYQLLVCQ